MSEAKDFRNYRMSINQQPGQVLRLCSLPLQSCSSKCVTEIYRAHYGDAIFVLLRGPQIWRPELCKHLVHKFDQLFTANEQIFPLNTFSNTFTIQRPYYHAIKFFLAYVTAFSVAMLMSRGVNLGI